MFIKIDSIAIALDVGEASGEGVKLFNSDTAQNVKWGIGASSFILILWHVPLIAPLPMADCIVFIWFLDKWNGKILESIRAVSVHCYGCWAD